MKIKRDLLERIKVREGRVLVKIDYTQKDSVLIGEATISLSPLSTISQSALSVRRGIVYKVPKSGDWKEMNYSFKPEVEIEVGDMVWWREGAVWEMLKSRKDEEVFFECEDEKYLVMPYQEMMLCKRGHSFHALNDRVVCRKITPEVNSFLDLSHTSLVEPLKDEFIVDVCPTGKGYYNDDKRSVSVKSGMRVKVGGGGRMVGVVEGEFDRVLPEDMVYFRTSDIIEYEC